MRATKAQAKQAVDVYGNLLQERAVISDIEKSEGNAQVEYEFVILDPKFNYPVKCTGVIELALVLTAMWSAYMRARTELGME